MTTPQAYVMRVESQGGGYGDGCICGELLAKKLDEARKKGTREERNEKSVHTIILFTSKSFSMVAAAFSSAPLRSEVASVARFHSAHQSEASLALRGR